MDTAPSDIDLARFNYCSAVANVGILKTMVAMNQIEGFAQRIGHEFGAERVMLFGSYVRGKVTDDSDVDLLVIAPFEGRGDESGDGMTGRFYVDVGLNLR